jgi:hypothetical protein
VNKLSNRGIKDIEKFGGMGNEDEGIRRELREEGKMKNNGQENKEREKETWKDPDKDTEKEKEKEKEEKECQNAEGNSDKLITEEKGEMLANPCQHQN